MSAPELASVDGEITATPEARIPPGDDGLLRGDGVFEVIRLYGGRPVRPRRAPGPPRALGGGDRARGPAGRRWRARSTPCSSNSATIDGAAAPGRHPRRPAPRVHRELPAARRVGDARDGRLQRRRSSSRASSPSPTGRTCRRRAWPRARAPTRPCSCGPTGSCSRRPPPPSSGHATAPCARPSIETGILASITRDRLVRELDVAEGEYPLDDLMGADEAFLASTVREVQPISAMDGTELPARRRAR